MTKLRKTQQNDIQAFVNEVNNHYSPREIEINKVFYSWLAANPKENIRQLASDETRTASSLLTFVLNELSKLSPEFSTPLSQKITANYAKLMNMLSPEWERFDLSFTPPGEAKKWEDIYKTTIKDLSCRYAEIIRLINKGRPEETNEEAEKPEPCNATKAFVIYYQYQDDLGKSGNRIKTYNRATKEKGWKSFNRNHFPRIKNIIEAKNPEDFTNTILEQFEQALEYIDGPAKKKAIQQYRYMANYKSNQTRNPFL